MKKSIITIAMVIMMVTTSALAEVRGLLMMGLHTGKNVEAPCVITTHVDEDGITIYTRTDDSVFYFSIADVELVEDIGEKSIRWIGIAKKNPDVEVDKYLDESLISITGLNDTKFKGKFRFQNDSEGFILTLLMVTDEGNFIVIGVAPSDCLEFAHELAMAKMKQDDLLQKQKKADAIFK